MDFSAVKRVYFVGVGGVGVNALAKFVADFGIDVCGSDAKINDLCRILDCSVSEVLEYIPDEN